LLRLIKARHDHERRACVDSFEVLVAKQRVELAKEMIHKARFGMIRGVKAIRVTSRDGKRQQVVEVRATGQNAPYVLAMAEQKLEEVENGPPSLTQRHNREFNEYSTLYNSLWTLRPKLDLVAKMETENSCVLEGLATSCSSIIHSAAERVSKALTKEEELAVERPPAEREYSLRGKNPSRQRQETLRYR
jgi:hypothetical protein